MVHRSNGPCETGMRRRGVILPLALESISLNEDPMKGATMSNTCSSIIQMCKPLPRFYVIREEAFHKIGVGKITLYGRNLGVDLIQVSRRVLQVCVEHDIFYNSKKVCGIPSPLQLLSDYLGLGKITTKPTGKRNFLLAYAGYTNFGEVFGAQARLPNRTSALFRYGTDPIPEVQLYKNERVPFISNGGRGPYQALAVYDGAARRLDPIVSRTEQDKMLQNVLKANPALYR
jgi:hypothetical protein